MTIAEVLLTAPETQLDGSMKPLIAAWSVPPTPLEILHVLDQCVYGSLASTMIMRPLNMAYDDALQRTGETHDQMVALAAWRQNDE